MAFVVETGTGLSNSNSYITVDFFKDYHDDRGRSIVDGSGNSVGSSVIKAALVVASDYIDTKFTFIGIRSLTTQNMEWPRVDAFYQDGRIANGIPIEIQECVAELALKQLSSDIAPDPTYDDSNRLITKQRNKVGPIEQETEFGSNGSPISFRAYPFAERRLKELIITGTLLERV